MASVYPIRTESDYESALEEIERLMNAAPNTPEGDLLDVWATLVQDYENEHYAIPAPDPIELILHVMEARELTIKDMEAVLGNESVIAEILHHQRPLTLEMIRNLHTELGLPADVLIQPYALDAETESIAG